MAMDFLVGAPIKELQEIGKKADEQFSGPKGYEVDYDVFGINGKMLGHGDPIRVKQGERVPFHVLNASAGEIRSLALPGHVFRIIALDGNPVPTQTDVPVLWLGTAERISAIVEMNHPGVWVMGDLDDDDRRHGMGVVVEYAGAKGKPHWAKPKPYNGTTRYSAKPALRQHRPMKRSKSQLLSTTERSTASTSGCSTVKRSRWIRWSRLTPCMKGAATDLSFRNASDDIHPLHLHRHSFELVHVGGKPTAGVIKDVVMLGGFQEVEFDFVADDPGPTLFHCHQQLHMDFGYGDDLLCLSDRRAKRRDDLPPPTRKRAETGAWARRSKSCWFSLSSG